MLQILADVVAGTATAEDSVQSNKTPFLPGRMVEAYINVSSTVGDGNAVVKIQSSPDDTAWTDVLIGGGVSDKVGMVKCDKYMRATVTTAAGTTAGVYSAYLRGGD